MNYNIIPLKNRKKVSKINNYGEQEFRNFSESAGNFKNFNLEENFKSLKSSTKNKNAIALNCEKMRKNAKK